jgi:DNA polymerase delta subunit 1
MRHIVGIEVIDFKGYVFDASTKDGSFKVLPMAGYDGILMKNTDSVYVRWKDVNMHDAFKLSEEAAEHASAQFPKPVLLEFEKVMCPLALYTKKRYSFQMWQRPDQPEVRIQHVGTQVIRRDTCPYVRNLLACVLDLILKENKIEDALAYTRQRIGALFANDVPIGELTLTRNYKDNYVNTNIPHVRLAHRLRDRKDVDMVRPGERIAFVMIDSTDKLETPAFAKANKISLDAKAYFEKQLQTPLDMIWGLVMDPESVYHDLLCQYQKRQKKEKDMQGYLRLFHRV